MECAVYDTYVNKKSGGTMHFDIIVPTEINEEEAFKFGQEYLQDKGEGGQIISSKECKFCHIERAEGNVEEAILSKGYFILEMQGC